MLTQNAVPGVCACVPPLCALASVFVRCDAEVEIIQWFVKVGDKIQAFDRVCEVQSDKASVEISSRYDGEVVKVYTEVGGIANVGQPLIDVNLPCTRVTFSARSITVSCARRSPYSLIRTQLRCSCCASM